MRKPERVTRFQGSVVDRRVAVRMTAVNREAVQFISRGLARSAPTGGSGQSVPHNPTRVGDQKSIGHENADAVALPQAGRGKNGNAMIQRRISVFLWGEASPRCVTGRGWIRRIPFSRLSWMLFLLVLAGLPGCQRNIKEPYVIADFEADEDLDRFHWKCRTLFSLSAEHISHGKQSLRLEFYPSAYPGLAPQLKRKDWRGYHALCLSTFHPGNKPLILSIRIDDRSDGPDYPDRYNHGFPLQPGENHLSIPLESLVTSGDKRKLNLATIHTLLFFLVNPPQKEVLYFDYLRLEP